MAKSVKPKRVYGLDEDSFRRVKQAVKQVRSTPRTGAQRRRQAPVLSGSPPDLYAQGTSQYIDVIHASSADQYGYPVVTITTPGPFEGLILDARFLPGWYDGSTYGGGDAHADPYLLWTRKKHGPAKELEWIDGTVLQASVRHVLYVELDEEATASGLFDAHLTDGTGTYVGVACKMRIPSAMAIIDPLPDQTVCQVGYCGQFDGTPGSDTNATDVLPIFEFITANCE